MWVGHFRQGEVGLQTLLQEGRVVCHPFIMGELACGNLKNRSEILSLLGALPEAIRADDQEVLRFIEKKALMGKGLGYIDMHLLAAALLSHVCLWTWDRKLGEAARELGIRFEM